MSEIQPISVEARYRNAHQVLKCLYTNYGPYNTTVNPTWIENSDTFWYLRRCGSSKQFLLVDAASGSSEAAFDHESLAVGLARLSGEYVIASQLPFDRIDFDKAGCSFCFSAFGSYWQFYVKSQELLSIDAPVGSPVAVSEYALTNYTPKGVREVVSPDGRFSIVEKQWNLWLRELSSGEERQLTFDGEADYNYGGAGTAWGCVVDADLQVCWSPDSARVFTVQRDVRKVKAMPFVHHVPMNGEVRPYATYHKFALPGDEDVESLRLLSINIRTGEQQAADYKPIPVTRNNYGLFTSNLAWWGSSSVVAFFVHVDRYYKYVRVVAFNTSTGECDKVFEEESSTQINLMDNGDMWSFSQPLPESEELLWFSERGGWSHLYLYSLRTGEVISTITSGEWTVRDIIAVFPGRREVFIQTSGRVVGRNPYYRDVVRVNIDTGTLLSG